MRRFSLMQWGLACGLAVLVHLGLYVFLKAVPEPAQPQARGINISLQAPGAVPSTTTATAVEPPLAPAVTPETIQAAEPEMIEAAEVAAPATTVMAEVKPPEPKPKPKSKPKPKPRSQPRATPRVEPKPPTRSGAETRPAPQRSPTAASGPGRQAKAAAGTAVSQTRPSPLSNNPRPPYPRIARLRGYEGRVIVRVSVLANGRVADARIRQSSGHGVLDRSALKTVKRWRFQPARRNGQAVAATVDVPITFQLEQS